MKIWPIVVCSSIISSCTWSNPFHPEIGNTYNLRSFDTYYVIPTKDSCFLTNTRYFKALNLPEQVKADTKILNSPVTITIKEWEIDIINDWRIFTVSIAETDFVCTISEEYLRQEERVIK